VIVKGLRTGGSENIFLIHREKISIYQSFMEKNEGIEWVSMGEIQENRINYVIHYILWFYKY
tara:strand:+ start:153 stop:338 length:186 start_codon:yes stop_codon:yes gene_type:complete